MILEYLGQIWRALATGISFVLFGLGELLLAFIVFPLLKLFVRNDEDRKRLAKAIVHQSFRAFVAFMRYSGAMDYEIYNLERLQRPGLLVLANHPSLIDVVFLISFIRQADCIVKGALIYNPFTRYAILASGYIRNTDGPTLIDRCSKSLADGNTLIIFPEGTRSENNRLREFQRGAAHVAMRSGRNITPVVIRVQEHNLGRGSSWWKSPKKRPRFEFKVEEDIVIEPFLKRHTEDSAIARDLTEHLSRYFLEKMEEHGNFGTRTEIAYH